MVTSVHDELKSGFIFIPVDTSGELAEIPPNYVASRRGSLGYFAKLDSDSCVGWNAVNVTEYLEASS